VSPDEIDVVRRVALAALLHDVGKFAQRAEADPERYRTLENLHLFCVTDDKGATRYHHAAYTWQFIADHLNWLTRLGDGDETIAGWAARHHKPSSAIDWIVAEADRLSAGMERGHRDESLAGWAAVQQARLEPITARIANPAQNQGSPKEQTHELPLSELEFAKAIFGLPKAQRAQKKAADEYRALFDGFVRRVGQLPHGDLDRFFVEFLAVYEQFAWCVPAATNSAPHDVSLFEHSRAASAVAAALGYQLIAAKSLDETSACDRKAQRYALMVGDLSGIQKFIYTITAAKAARSLRARSLVLQLLSDAIAHKFLEALKLPPVSLLYNGGGRIWLLLPLCAQEQAKRMSAQIDAELETAPGGRLAFSAGFAAMSGEDFVDHRVFERWNEAIGDLGRCRLGRFRTLASERYTELFGPRGDPSKEAPCGICGSLSDSLEQLQDEDLRVCPECREFIELGRVVPYAHSIIRVAGSDREARAKDLLRHAGNPQRTALFAPKSQLLGCAYIVSARDAADWRRPAKRGDIVFTINQWPDSFDGDASAATWLVGLNRAVSESQEPLDFEDLANSADGVARLGVLRMDVDSLGDIFADGFAEPERTLSRLTNLSKSLTYFFAGYVSHLAASDQWASHVQIIYSGGDDLFLVGPWSKIPQFAREVRQSFHRFVCGSPAWGLSGGIAVVRPKYPVAAAAGDAGELESAAKRYQRDGKCKDALGFLDDTLGWDELEVAQALALFLKGLLEAGGSDSMPRAVLHKLGEIARMYRQSLQTLGDHAGAGTISIQELAERARRGRWAWTAAYTLSRAARTEALRAKLDMLANSLSTKQFNSAKSDRDVIDLLRPAVAWADYLTRKREGR